MKIYELILESEEHGIDAISLVENPAIEEDFIALSKQEKVEFKAVDEERRILLGAALTPDKLIYRNSDDKGEYYVRMSKKTVREAAQNFLKNGNQANWTFEHEEKIQGVSVVESWIIEGEHDKSMNFGMTLPQGTWMVAVKVDNEAIWENFVKTGKVKGFSIEAFLKIKENFSSDIITDLEELIKKSNAK